MPLNDVLRHRAQAITGSINSHRILLYTLVSTVAVSAAIANALKNHSNFYSVAIYLSKSSRSVLVLANFGFLFALLCGHIVQQIFFGALRPAEIERLYDRLWFFITESLLAFTIFRDEFDIAFALMFGLLLFVKSFHWLAADRIEWMDQRPYPGPPPLFHIRMSTLFLILWTTDFLMFLIAVENTVAKGIGGMVLFASEYAILMASVMNTISKYLLSAYELRRAGQRGGENAPPWDNKSMWVFYIELATDFLKLSTYLIFFTIIITFYGLPLNIVRDVYITARSFIVRLRAFHRYQTATRNMDQRYPNATEEEMSTMNDRTCIICREEMVLRGPAENSSPPVGTDGPNITPKKLPCGHIFHFHCLRSWLERQQSCPTCRRTVLDANPPPQQPLAAGAPQAGAGPALQNPLGPLGAQNPQGANNPFGLVGRFFGAGAQPPIPPGQFAPQAQFPQPPNIPNLPQNPGGLVGQQPGLIIQYHIQYQPPRHPQQQQEPNAQNLHPQPPPQPLQPAPQFPGFHGPGGAWQPWAVDPRWFGNAAQNPPQEAANPAPAVSPTDATQTQPSQAPSSVSSAPNDSANSLRGDDRPATPREAAALAALRRSHIRPSATSPESSSIPVPPSISPESTDAPASSSPSDSTSSAHPTQPPIGSASDQRPGAPLLVPLYDYSPYGSTASFSPASTPQVPNGVTQHSAHFRRPSGARVPPFPTQSSPGAHSQQGSYQPYPRGPAPRFPTSDVRYQQGNTRTPITQLPPTLTDEQLAVMDRLSREAIDERLRVLEGVSGAVYRCIDDLMRMRSVLPPIPSVGTTPRPGPTASSVGGSDATAANLQPPLVPPTEELNNADADAAEPMPSGSQVNNDGPASQVPDLAVPSPPSE